jgi:hypothetical protein
MLNIDRVKPVVGAAWAHPATAPVKKLSLCPVILCPARPPGPSLRPSCQNPPIPRPQCQGAPARRRFDSMSKSRHPERGGQVSKKSSWAVNFALKPCLNDCRTGSEVAASAFGIGHAIAPLMKKLHPVLVFESKHPGVTAIPSAGQPKTIFVRFEGDANAHSVPVRFEGFRRRPPSSFLDSLTLVNRLSLQPAPRHEF